MGPIGWYNTGNNAGVLFATDEQSFAQPGKEGLPSLCANYAVFLVNFDLYNNAIHNRSVIPLVASNSRSAERELLC